MSEHVKYTVEGDNGVTREFTAISKEVLNNVKKSFNKQINGHKSTRELLEEMGIINPRIVE